jgi:hypothetical protein
VCTASAPGTISVIELKFIAEDHFTKPQTLKLFTINIEQKGCTEVIKNAKFEGFS